MLDIQDDLGGSALTRLDPALIFEALATGCPTVSAFISIHDMCAGMMDRYGSEAQRQAWWPAASRSQAPDGMPRH